MPPCLTLSIITYGSRVKWSNPWNGGMPFPTPRCSSYWKGNLRVAFDYGRQFYLHFLQILRRGYGGWACCVLLDIVQRANIHRNCAWESMAGCSRVSFSVVGVVNWSNFSVKLVCSHRLQSLWLKINGHWTMVKGDPIAPFSITTTLMCRGGSNSILWIASLTLESYLIGPTVKQNVIKYKFLSLRYEATWNWTLVS